MSGPAYSYILTSASGTAPTMTSWRWRICDPRGSGNESMCAIAASTPSIGQGYTFVPDGRTSVPDDASTLGRLT